jgi:hypothetical protein
MTSRDLDRPQMAPFQMGLTFITTDVEINSKGAPNRQ